MRLKNGLLIPCVVLGSAIGSTTYAAGCSDGGYTAVTDAYSVLINKRVVANRPDLSEEWKEDHCNGNRVLKVGDGTAADPYTQYANWIAVGGFVQYTYGDPGGPYTWRLYTKSSNTEVCFENIAGDTVIAVGTVEAAGPCI